MYEPIQLDSKELQQLLSAAAWKLDQDHKKISKEFIFPDFKEAFSFMTAVALKSEQLNHHPEWFNVYNRIQITWSTHDIQGLSLHDIEMAKFCDGLFQKRS